MPPKKKQPANAFYFYMLERKAHYERIGEKFPNGLKDVAEVAGPEWQVLPASMKKKYEDLAKQEKERQKNDLTRKYTNQHTPFAYIDKTQAEEDDLKRNISRTIEKTVSAHCATGKIAEFKFFLIHVNYFCRADGDCFRPAEIAVAEFSLAEGVIDVYHTMVKGGNFPLGFLGDAKIMSESVHHIPVNVDGEKQLHIIWNKIKALLEHGRNAHGGSYPPMYTMPDNVNLNTSISCVRSVLKNLCESVDDDPENFPVYPLENLCFELKNSCAELSGLEDSSNRWPSIPFARLKLEEDIYNYTPNIACQLHQQVDEVTNCSKSFVQRWAFLICDEVCQYLNIPLIPGKHVPQNADVNYKQKREQRDLERNDVAAAKPVKEFTIVEYSSGKPKTTSTFLPVEFQHQPLPHPKNRAALEPTQVYSTLENSEENFPAIPVGRGRGRGIPRGGGRGSGPMSFAAAAQGKK